MSQHTDSPVFKSKMAAPVDNMREDSHRKSRKRSRDAAEDQANQSVSDEPDQNPPKVQKAQDGREFRKSLKEGGGDLQDILKNFLISCKDSAPESGVDVIMQYLEVAPQCEDLLDILNDENRPNLVMVCTLRILTTVLIRFAESQSKYGVVSLHIVRRLVRVHFGIVMSFLNVPKDWRSTKTALRLLTVIMTLGKQCAQELLSVFNLDHPSLQKLAQSRRPKEKEDPRTHFVQFAMSIFMTGNSDIIEKAVASKEFCRNVFHHVALDRVPTIQLLLRTLQDRVIKKPVIPKKSKKLLFNNFTLSQLIELYDCSKPVEAADVDIPHMVHNVLQLVCCSHKYGICYTDASLGLNGGRVANLTLLRFVSNFKTTSILNDPLMEDLFISIFKVCPDVLTPYLKGRSTKFTPRPYPDWLNNIILFEKIYNCFPDISPALMEKKRNTTVSRLLGLVAVTTLPFVYTREEYVKNFKGLCIPVHFGLLKICKIFLKRTLKTIKFCEDQKKEANSMLSPEEWTEFIDSLKKSAREIMPDAEFFIGMYEKYQTHLRSENRKEDDYKDWVKKQMATPVPIPKPELVICGVLDILRLQQTLFPNCLQGLSLDLNAIFSESLSVLFIKNLSDEENLSIAIVQRLMEFLAGVPPKKILWFKESKRSGSIFSQVLTLLLSSKLVQQEAEQLLCKILMETGHFENNKEEAMSWLVTLDDLSKSDQVGVIDLLRKSLIKIVRNPHPFNDRIAEAMTKRQQLLENDLQSETASVAEAGIAAILDQEEYTIEVMSDVVTMETNPASDRKTTMDKPLYCSALLPAALEEFFNLLTKSKGETGGFERYVTSVTFMIMNQQRDPVPISILIKDCHQSAIEKAKTEIKFSDFEKCLQYCQFWLQTGSKGKRTTDAEAFRKLKKTLGGYDSFSQLLQDSFMIGSEVSCDGDVMSSLTGLAQSLPTQKILPVIKQIMLYMQNVIGNDASRLNGTLVYILYTILQRAKELDCASRESRGLSEEKTESDIPWEAIAHSLFENGDMPSWGQYGTSLSFPEELEKDLGGSCLQKHFLVLLEHFFTDCLTSERFRGIADDVFSQISSECHERLTALQNTTEYSKWNKYYCASDWLQHVGLASPKVFEGLCCKIISMLSSESNDSSKTLTDLFLELPKNMKDLPKPALTDFVLAVELQCNTKLDEIFCSTIELMPDVTIGVSMELLKRCLATEDSKEMYSRLLRSLITHSLAHRIHFARFCSTDEGQKVVKKKLKKESATFLPVVYSYLSITAGQTKRQTEDEEAFNVLQDLVWSRLMKLYQEGEGEEEGDLRELQDDLLAVMVKVVSTQKLESQVEKICSKEETLNRSRLGLLTTLNTELSSRGDGDAGKRRSDILDAILVSCGSSSSAIQLLHYDTILSLLQMAENFEPSDSFISNIKQFIQDGLKNHYQSPVFQTLLKRLISQVYRDKTKEVKGLLSLKKIFHMMISHSMFLPSMMGDEEEEEKDDASVLDVKGHLISTILFIVQREPSCCSSDHVVVWLGAYSATRSSSDRMLLEMLELYEKNGISLNDYRPFLWGQPAVTQHAARKSLGKALWTQPTMKEVLGLLDHSKMLKSSIHLPLDQPLSRQEIGSQVSEPNDLYDPSFLLPLFSSLLGPECLVECLTFVQCKGLFMTVAALSSQYQSMREAGYHVLAQFDQHLEGARFRGRREISYLLTCLKNTVTEPNARLPSVTTAFVGRAFDQMLDASGPLFKHIIQYTALEPKLPLNLVPAFNGLFFSASEKHEMERGWMLDLLEDGMRDYPDFIIYVRNNLWSLLMGLASSPHCSPEEKLKVLAILERAVTIPPAALSLVTGHSLMTWTLTTSKQDEEEVARVLSILEVTLRSIMDLWKKNSTSDLEKVITKLCDDILVNCHSMLTSLKLPSSDLLLRIISLMQKVLHELEWRKMDASSVRKQFISEVVMHNLVQIYYRTTHDPGFNVLVQPVSQDPKASELTDHQEWIGEALNKEAADVLYYLIYHWLKYFSSSEVTNHSVSDSTTNGSSACLHSDSKVRLRNQTLLSTCICWSLTHFVRRKALTHLQPEFSQTLAAICSVLKSISKESEIFQNGGIKENLIKSCLSIYHVLTDPFRNRCLDNAERVEILCALNEILLYLTKFSKVPKPFKGHLKKWSKLKGQGDDPMLAAFDQERLSVLLRELWSGSISPSCYQQLPDS